MLIPFWSRNTEISNKHQTISDPLKSQGIYPVYPGQKRPHYRAAFSVRLKISPHLIRYGQNNCKYFPKNTILLSNKQIDKRDQKGTKRTHYNSWGIYITTLARPMKRGGCIQKADNNDWHKYYCKWPPWTPKNTIFTPAQYAHLKYCFYQAISWQPPDISIIT